MELIHLAQRAVGSCLHLHHHLEIRAKFCNLRQPTPKPPNFLGITTFLHATQLTLWVSPRPPQRNRLRIFSISSMTFLGALNIDRKYKGNEPSTALINVSLPPKERHAAFQELSLFFNLSKIGFQLTDLPILATMGKLHVSPLTPKTT
ncbi:hypothetical protein HanIR_Chr14g0695661 [Helianthus annuus]|nr:hypothetical protein HanIR_Chr14g0695661 [Helianthus annuus]